MKLATIERIHSILPHPRPDVNRLEVGKIKEWPVVIPKGKFKDNDMVVFIQIDSIVPKTNPYFAFLEKEGYRIRNSKFKGYPSQGLVCSIEDVLPEIKNDSDLKVGQDVTQNIGIIKYVKPVDITVSGDAVGSFPTNFISITDEDNFLNYPECLNEFYGERCYITVKADGSSMTVINDDGQIRVCSRNQELKENIGLWKLANKYDLPNKLKLNRLNLAIQGEACGGKIQGNPLGLIEPAMYVFNIKDITTGKNYGWSEIKDVCKLLGIPTVTPVLEDFEFTHHYMNMSVIQDIANSITYNKANGQNVPGEGIVIRPMIPKFSPNIGKLLSLKVINQNYKD